MIPHAVSALLLSEARSYKMGRAAMRVHGVCVPRTVRALFCRFSHFAHTIDRTMGRQ